jgi:hypothetical protein
MPLKEKTISWWTRRKTSLLCLLLSTSLSRKSPVYLLLAIALGMEFRKRDKSETILCPHLSLSPKLNMTVMVFLTSCL